MIFKDQQGFFNLIHALWITPLPEPFADYRTEHAFYLLLALYAIFLFFKFLVTKVKTNETLQMGIGALEKRNSKMYNFKLEDIDADHILSLDLNGLKEGLSKGTFTSKDLVKVFGERSQRIGRTLNLSAEENFS